MIDLPVVLSTSTVYEGRLFNVDLTELRMPNGVIARREGITHPGAVCMVPVTSGGGILFVTQYRHAAGRRLLELPAGTLERGEAPEPAAIRELREEVGMRPGRVDAIGGFYVAPGYTSEYIHLFVCSELTPGALAGDEDEDIEIEELTVDQAVAAIAVGTICDAKSIIGVLRWLQVSDR